MQVHCHGEVVLPLEIEKEEDLKKIITIKLIGIIKKIIIIAMEKIIIRIDIL